MLLESLSAITRDRSTRSKYTDVTLTSVTGLQQIIVSSANIKQTVEKVVKRQWLASDLCRIPLWNVAIFGDTE